MTASTFIAGVDKFLNNQVSNEAKIKNQQLCTTTADNVLELFVKDQKPFASEVISDHHFENSKIVERLLAQPNCKENLIAHFHILRGLHSFVIIKVSDGAESRFRLIHSFNGEFSLGMWLGLEPWNNKGISDFSQHIYKQYNKPLTQNETKELLIKMLDNWARKSVFTLPRLYWSHCN